MKLRSTRGDQTVTLDQALVQGLASDGGLFIPDTLPSLDWQEWQAEGLVDVATSYLRPFFKDSRLIDALPEIAAETFSFPIPRRSFSIAEGDAAVLELFHGPTAAFKDVGARFLAACLTRFEQSQSTPLKILVATSGDTGGAVAAAFHGRPGIEVVVLFPEGRVSPRQQHQLTCWGDNVSALSVEGSFDDCQRLVKAAFVDGELSQQHRFSSANSINIGRLLPQSVYYANAALEHWRQTQRRLSFVIPTGNLGNGLAAVLARACGLPIGDIRFMSNANRTLPDYFDTGVYEPRDSQPTLASAMDVGAPSNLERLRAVFGERDALQAQALEAMAVDDETIALRIREDAARLPFVWCPHSATAMSGWLDLSAERREHDWCLVATAHPAKFETIVEPLIGRELALPPALEVLLERPTEYAVIGPQLEALADALGQGG